MYSTEGGIRVPIISYRSALTGGERVSNLLSMYASLSGVPRYCESQTPKGNVQRSSG
jgi:hypothetical protein